MRNLTRFTRTAILAALSALTLALATAAGAALDPRYDPARAPIPALHPIRAYKPERLALPNGMVVYLQEDHRLPLVTGTLYCRASNAWAPAEKTGLGGLTGEVMRSGGTSSISPPFGACGFTHSKLAKPGGYLRSPNCP